MRIRILGHFVGCLLVIASSACSSQVPDHLEIKGVPSAAAPAVASFDECVAAGYPVLRSFPPQCITPDGKKFIGAGAAVGEVKPIEITSFDECVAAGNLIRRTLPATCMTSEGKVFSDDKGANPSQRLDVSDTPPLEASKPCKDSCGDGECQEIVCMAVGCPCAETSISCPKDCK